MSQPYWVEVMVEVELRLILRLKIIWNWGCNEVEMSLSRSLIEIEFRLSWDKLTSNKGRNWAFIGYGSKYVLGLLIWNWGWNEVEMRLSWSLVEIKLRLSWDKLTLNKGRNWAFIGMGLWFKICFRSTYVAEQHMFPNFSSILAFNFI